MHSRRSLVGAGLAAVTAAGLAAVLAGTGQTYASLSDFAMVTGSAAAGVWAPDPPAACFANNRKYPGGIVYGTSGPDVLGGGNQGQIIMGLAGDDIIHGNNAKDCLVGGPGDDLIQGGNGKDHLDGGSQPGDICVVEIRKDDFTGCTPVERGRGGAGARRDQATPEPEARAVTEATPGSAEAEAVDPSQNPSIDADQQIKPVAPTSSEPPAVGQGLPEQPTATPRQQDFQPAPPDDASPTDPTYPTDPDCSVTPSAVIPAEPRQTPADDAEPEQATCLMTPAP